MLFLSGFAAIFSLGAPDVKESKRSWILLHAMDSGLQLLDSGFFVSGTWILDSNR